MKMTREDVCTSWFVPARSRDKLDLAFNSVHGWHRSLKSRVSRAEFQEHLRQPTNYLGMEHLRGFANLEVPAGWTGAEVSI